MGGKGLVTTTVDGVTYVVQPGLEVKPGVPTGTAQLTIDEDGNFQFTDTLGNKQTLFPALLEAPTLTGHLLQLDGTASPTILPNGTMQVGVSGQNYILVPDLTLGGVPPEHAADAWWQDGPNHYRFRNTQPPYENTSQGFTAILKNSAD